MKVHELMELLNDFDQGAEVKVDVFDGDSPTERLLEVADVIDDDLVVVLEVE